MRSFLIQSLSPLLMDGVLLPTCAVRTIHWCRLSDVTQGEIKGVPPVWIALMCSARVQVKEFHILICFKSKCH